MPPKLMVWPSRERVEEGWQRLRRLLEAIVEESIPALIDIAGRRPDPIVYALAGRAVAYASALERSIVTRFGRRAKELVTPWFEECTPLDGFWDYRCLRDNGRETRTYTIKMVSGAKAFNSTMRRRVEEESARLQNPVVLTATGVFERDHYEEIGKAYWLDAPATWLLLTGSPRGYKRFLDTLFEVGKPYRATIYKQLLDMSRR